MLLTSSYDFAEVWHTLAAQSYNYLIMANYLTYFLRPSGYTISGDRSVYKSYISYNHGQGVSGYFYYGLSDTYPFLTISSIPLYNANGYNSRCEERFRRSMNYATRVSACATSNNGLMLSTEEPLYQCLVVYSSSKFVVWHFNTYTYIYGDTVGFTTRVTTPAQFYFYKMGQYTYTSLYRWYTTYSYSHVYSWTTYYNYTIPAVYYGKYTYTTQYTYTTLYNYLYTGNYYTNLYT